LPAVASAAPKRLPARARRGIPGLFWLYVVPASAVPARERCRRVTVPASVRDPTSSCGEPTNAPRSSGAITSPNRSCTATAPGAAVVPRVITSTSAGTPLAPTA
jgi:hypothetical protein